MWEFFIIKLKHINERISSKVSLNESMNFQKKIYTIKIFGDWSFLFLHSFFTFSILFHKFTGSISF